MEHDGRRETARNEIDMAGTPPPVRAGRLVAMGVEVLLCGGISAPVAALVESQGIRVMAGLVGEFDAVLAAFFAGGLSDPSFAMPGWRCCGGGMGGRHRRRRGRPRGKRREEG